METEVNINENRPPVNNTKKLELDKENFDITQRFGKYLSEQYEVLERTLSYLNIDDLISASQVSTSWKKVTECLLKKRRRAAKVRWHIQHKPIIPNHYFKKHINFEIQFVLGIGFELKNTKNIVLNQLLEDKSYICSSTREDVRNGRNIPGLLDANMIFVKTWGNDIPYYVEDKLNYSRNLPAAILFPKMNGVRIFIVPIKNNEFEFCPASLKGILLLNRKSRFNALERALLSIEGDAEESIVVGGGMFEHIQRFCQNRGKLGRCEDLSICFCGENVSCHSEVLYFNELNHTEEFLIKMKNTIGPFDPRKQQRMAFIIRCVTRSNGECENNLFKKHFPDVPAFMLLSLGEYGRDYEKSFEDDSPAVKKRRHRVLVQYAYSVVYFFVTFNLSQ